MHFPFQRCSLHLRCGKCFLMKTTYSFGCINEDYCSVTYSERCCHFIREIYLTCCNTERPPLSSHYVKLQMFIVTARQLSGEGNVFNPVYLSFCLPTVGGEGEDVPCTGFWPPAPDTFKLVDYETRTTGNQAVGI